MKNIIKEPAIAKEKEKHTIKLHFDMFHGNGVLDKDYIMTDEKDKKDFKNYVHNSRKFNPHIMFIAKPLTFQDFYLFQWLFKCEKIFGFKELKGYDTKIICIFS